MGVRNSEVLPHSWEITSWPPSVWPNDTGRARWLVRAYRDQLLRHKALTRVGKRIVILGDGWSRFLAACASDVRGFHSNNQSCGRADSKHRATASRVEQAA